MTQTDHLPPSSWATSWQLLRLPDSRQNNRDARNDRRWITKRQWSLYLGYNKVTCKLASIYTCCCFYMQFNSFFRGPENKAIFNIINKQWTGEVALSLSYMHFQIFNLYNVMCVKRWDRSNMELLVEYVMEGVWTCLLATLLYRQFLSAMQTTPKVLLQLRVHSGPTCK